MFEATIKEFSHGRHRIRLETGRIAPQATSAVLVTVDDHTSVLVTLVASSTQREDHSFFPLTVQYQERPSAVGKIPGGFFKREGRPSEKETLTSRLIDRPIRPLFPKHFFHDVQIIATVLSLDTHIDPDWPAMVGAFAAVACSGLPARATLGAARVGYVNNELVLNPSVPDMEASALDLMVAGTQDAVVMVESEAHQLSESLMLEAVLFGHQAIQDLIAHIDAFANEVQAPAFAWSPPASNDTIASDVEAHLPALVEAYQLTSKTERAAALADVRASCEARYVSDTVSSADVEHAVGALERRLVRERILEGAPRIDGRDNHTVRPITIDAGCLPRAHGSVLFTRGETQAMVTATLGPEDEAQTIDDLKGKRKEHFMLHYNFPPYSVGEVGMVGSPRRREIGHGRLAKRAVQSLLPDAKEFPYVIRVVSDITSSNGSSSMATVCGASLALMDAGVPVRAPVAGIAMGLIKEGERFAVLTDILGDEDHLGDMDFKVAGTRAGITALQMDIKTDGITRAILEQALKQAQAARLHILDKMADVLPAPRAEVSQYAPRIITLQVPVDKIRDIIGKGGVVIRGLTEATGASIDIADDGTVTIAAVDATAGLEAKHRIEQITLDAEVGGVYEGKVVKIVEFGAFVNFLPGRDGLVHISQLSRARVEQVQDVVSEGQTVRVKVLDIDRQGRVRLSIKALETTEETSEEAT